MALYGPKRVALYHRNIQRGLEISTIHSYKGLENVVIVLFDFPEISSKISKHLLYVGISRATQQLYILLNTDLEKSYQKLISTNLPKFK